MSFRLIIKEEAAQDIREAFHYYQKIQSGLGQRFLDYLELYVERIVSNPFQYQTRNDIYREACLRKFPYNVIYEIFGNEIVVYAVFCTYKNPTKKPKSS